MPLEPGEELVGQLAHGQRRLLGFRLLGRSQRLSEPLQCRGMGRLDDLADYAARVATMRNPIQRDGLMLALYTGLRSEDVRTVRWEFVDLDNGTLRLPDPKGGEDAAFTIPLSRVPVEILTRRQRDNASAIGADDNGWAFPAFANDGKVGAITDLRQQVKAGGPAEAARRRNHERPHLAGTAPRGAARAATNTKHGRFPVEDVHTLRRTWESIAHEEGVTELDQHVLSNHSFGGHNVNAKYISQSMEHLATCADKIDAGITRRITDGSKPAKGGTKVPRSTAKLRSIA